MLTQPRTIKLTRNSNLTHLLKEAARSTVVLEKNGVRYRLKREKPKAKPQSKRNADYTAFISAAGSWKNIDTDHFISNVYKSRKLSIRPPVKL